MEKNIVAEYWRDSGNAWLNIAAEATPETRLFCCNRAEESFDKMDASKLQSRDDKNIVPAAIG